MPLRHDIDSCRLAAIADIEHAIIFSLRHDYAATYAIDAIIDIMTCQCWLAIDY
jgi:hypothetical protein